ncbi:MAG: TonB-dependent receptor [Acidobacteria bacterium]|nr:TonB-dependent receptor [Acidobacteriota bacterium]
MVCRYALVLCLAVWPGCLNGQDFRATITGQVTDASGSAIAGAKVRAVQRTTNQSIERETNAEGFYTLPYLQPSTYDIDVTAPGFRGMRRANITLLVADRLDLPFRMEVGEVSHQITVTAEAVDLLKTADASGGLSFDSLMTSEFALNGRQVFMLMDLAPGVLFTQEEFGSSGYSGTRGWDVNGSFTMNGGKSGTNSFSLNGAPISLTGSFQVAPNVDAIQEFKVMTNSYDASIGRTGGGSVNTTLKSGSNRYHGTLFNYMRNRLLDANHTQNNAVGAPRGKRITNQFGGTIGGAIRKDKDFFFASFEGFRERVPFPVVADTPPLDMRTGQNFTKYNMSVYDPLTAHPCVNNVDVTGTCSSPIIRDPFPGNVLPQSRISPIGRKILSYYPAPNINAVADNYVNSGSTGKYRYEQEMGRYDRIVDQNNRVFALFTFQDGSEYRNQTGIPGAAASGNIWSTRKNVNGIANWTRVLSPRAIFDMRASYGRFWQRFPTIDTSSSVTAETLGMSGMIHSPTSTGSYPPRLAIDQFSNLFGNGSNLYTWRADNQYNIVPSVTVASGSKTWRFGIDLVYAAVGVGDVGLANGYLQFTRWGTQRYPQRSALNAQDGSGVADVLLGIPGAGQIDWNDTYYRSWPYFGFFVQNDWKLKRNLTLNLGLRYDVQIPWVERWNRVNNGFDYTSKNPLSDQIIARWKSLKEAYDRTNPRFPYPDPPAAILGGKTFVEPGGNRRIYDTDWSNIQPRIGVAWHLEKRTVLRTGFGIFHRTATQSGQTDGFSLSTGYQRSLNGDVSPAAGLTGPYSLENPFPDGIVQPTGRELGLLTNAGNAVTYDARQRPIPRTFQYSFGFQRRAFWNILLDVSYAGSITNKDAMAINTDYWPAEFNQAAAALPTFGDTTVPNPFAGIVPANRTRGPGTIARRELFRQYPLFANVTNNTMPWASYRYDALQMRVDKRFSSERSIIGGLTMIFSYTFSKNLQVANYLNSWNFLHEKPVKELVSYDKPQNISFSGIYSLPFGRGRHFATKNKLVDGVVGGWGMNWVYRYTSGNPIAGINAVNTCGTLLLDEQTKGHWWNNDKTCWRGNPAYQLRVVEDRYAWLRQMDNVTVNLAASKTFTVTEKWKLQLRGEGFNLMNRPIYRPAPTTYTDARFGMLSIEQQNFPRNVQVSAKLLF